jgi:hypothetical protein
MSLRTTPMRLAGNVHQPGGGSQIPPGTKNAGQVRPVEYEANYYHQQIAQADPQA